MREGRLDWFTPEQVDGLPLPETDRRIIWPLIRAHEKAGAGGERPGFFALHIDCTEGHERMRWVVEHAEAGEW